MQAHPRLRTLLYIYAFFRRRRRRLRDTAPDKRVINKSRMSKLKKDQCGDDFFFCLSV